MAFGIVQREAWKGHILTNTDRVIAAVPLPVGSSFHGMDVDINLWSLEATAILAVMYGVAAYVVPVEDPENAQTYQNLWDTMVPKDIGNGAGVLDLDTGGVDSAPEFEWGDINWNALYDVSSAPTELYRRRRLLTIAGGKPIAATGTMTHWLPTASFRAHVRGGVTVKVPSAVMLAISSPVLDQTSGNERTLPTEIDWLRLMYMSDTVTDALKNVLGLVETGAETPWEEASALLEQTVEPTAFEETAAEFGTITWECAAVSTARYSVPGVLSVNAISSEG